MGSDHCPVYATLRATVGNDSDIHTIDLLNPPNTFRKGKRTETPMSSPPKLAMHLAPEFRGRQNLKSMFQKMSSKRVAPSTDKPEQSESLQAATARGSKGAANRTTLPSMAKKQKRSPITPPTASQKTLKTFFRPYNRTDTTTECSNSTDSRLSRDELSTALPTSTPPQATDLPMTEPGGDGRMHDPVEARQKWASLFTPKPKPRCDGHGEECVRYTVKKPGVNCGRSFWLCPR